MHDDRQLDLTARHRRAFGNQFRLDRIGARGQLSGGGRGNQEKQGEQPAKHRLQR